MQGCIAQILSLLETLWPLFARQGSEALFLGGDKFAQLMYLVISFCHLGKSAESLFVEDQNAFMVMFRNSDDELLTSISIRMSVVDFFDNSILSCKSLELSKIQQVLATIYTS